MYKTDNGIELAGSYTKTYVKKLLNQGHRITDRDQVGYWYELSLDDNRLIATLAPDEDQEIPSLRLQRYLATSQPRYEDVEPERYNYFLEQAVRINNQRIEQIRQRLGWGEEIRFSEEWYEMLRCGNAADRHQQKQAVNRREAKMVRCDCGHIVESALVMSASQGSSCPDCYDRMSD